MVPYSKQIMGYLNFGPSKTQVIIYSYHTKIISSAQQAINNFEVDAPTYLSRNDDYKQKELYSIDSENKSMLISYEI